MDRTDRTRVLLGQIAESREALGAISEAYARFVERDLGTLGKREVTASRLCDIIEHYYTCLETLFLRASRFFENDLAPDRWHQDLLDKMLLDVPGVRPRVISRATHERLLEFLRFRHFRRYYYEMDYDWDKLELLRKKLVEAVPLVRDDLERFAAFVEELGRGASTGIDR